MLYFKVGELIEHKSYGPGVTVDSLPRVTSVILSDTKNEASKAGQITIRRQHTVGGDHY